MRLVKIVFIAVALLVSCKNTPEDKKEAEVADTAEKVSKKDSSVVEVLFDDASFSSGQEKNLLKELGLGMCNPNETDLSNYKNPACDPKFFKLLPYKKNTELKNAFLLLVKSMVHDFPLRRLFVFQRVNGELVKVNGFIANLIGKRPSGTAYDDLILRFRDEDQNFFNCLYVWKNNHYEYKQVEQINDADIKAALQDSMNVEIHKVLLLNRMEF